MSICISSKICSTCDERATVHQLTDSTAHAVRAACRMGAGVSRGASNEVWSGEKGAG